MRREEDLELQGFYEMIQKVKIRWILLYLQPNIYIISTPIYLSGDLPMFSWGRDKDSNIGAISGFYWENSLDINAIREVFVTSVINTFILNWKKQTWRTC